MCAGDIFDPYPVVRPTQPDNGFQYDARRPTGMGTVIPAVHGQYTLGGNMLVGPSADLSGLLGSYEHRGLSPPQDPFQSNVYPEHALHQPVESPGLPLVAQQGFCQPLVNGHNMWADGETSLEREDLGSPLRCEMYPGGHIHLTTDNSPESSQVSSPWEFFWPTRRHQTNLIDFLSTPLADRRPAGALAQRVVEPMECVGPPRWGLPSISS